MQVKPVIMIQRYKTKAEWTAANPVLLVGELGIESDTHKAKIGDGITSWSGLAYCIDNVKSSSPTFNGIVNVDGRLDAQLQYEVLNG